jgi:hypothetical protein
MNSFRFVRNIVGVSSVVLLSVTTSLAREPVFEGLGSYSRKITTSSPKVQKYFNQGLGFYHGFNHGAAIRAFKEAARIDPKCAMAHWGIALANGPHINFPMVPPPAAEAAWKELIASHSTKLTRRRCAKFGNNSRTTRTWARFSPKR